jgi:hypothetical protein
MKYVIAWEVRENASSEETQVRGYEVFGKWSPAEGSDFLQFVDRIDGRGGFAVVEKEDPTLIARDTAVFGPFLNFNVYPSWTVRRGPGSSMKRSSSAAALARSSGWPETGANPRIPRWTLALA